MNVRVQASRASRVAILGLALFLTPAVGARRTPAIVTSGAIVVRERSSTVTTIGVSALEQLPGSRSIDTLIATLPSDRPLTPAHVPDGWKSVQKGRQLTASGPAMTGVDLRYDVKGLYVDDYAGKDATIQSGFGGKMDDPAKLKIQLLPPVDVTPNLQGILTLPPQGISGQPLLIGVTDPYRRGTWHFTTPGGESVPLLPLEALRDLDVIPPGTPQALYNLRGTDGLHNLLMRPAPRPFITTYPNGGFTRARYVDPFGELLVDGPVSIAPMPPATGARQFTAGSAFVFAGQAACISGRFPTFNDPYGLLLDGKIPLQPWGASPTTVMLGIPDGTAAGPHTISDPDGSSRITVGVLTVEGTLDQNKLWKGESTTMRLRVVGTDRQLPIGVLNRTPGIIDIDGGVDQTVTTTGGKDNVITRGVKGIHRGDFSIVYTVSHAGCGGL
jgi:hypothetical protein